MRRPKQRFSFFTKLNIATMILVMSAVLITGLLCLHYALDTKQTDMDAAITDISSMIAELPEVAQMLSFGESDPILNENLDTLISNLSQIDVLVICDTESVRYYHTAADRIGEKFIGGDEKDILSGSDPYISVATGTLGLQRRAFHAVKDTDGTIVGFVMASVLNENLVTVRNQITRTFELVLIFVLLITFIVVSVSRYSVERIFHGYNPEEFADLFIERAEVLDALEEGIFAIDTDGRIIMINQPAKKMLDLDAGIDPVGKPLVDFYPETQLPNTVKSGHPEYNVNFVINHHNIISSRIPIYKNEKIIGAVSIFRDKTEVTSMAEKLTGANTMVGTLRAFNHEFMNKLHVILGYLEMNDMQRAKDYILNTSLVSGKAVSNIHRMIPNSGVAALIIGKLVRANELGISFVLKNDSYYYETENDLPTDSYISIIGNLLENAMDELNSGDFDEKRIELGIYSEEGHTVIVCDDTGGGIPADVMLRLYDPHTTTKGEGHGIGWYTIRQIVDSYGGMIHIDTEPGEGTSVEVILPL